MTVLASIHVQSQQPSAAYRPPTITLAVPVSGEAIPADRPVIVLKFTAGEVNDSIDSSSLRLSVDGQDRTALLKLGDGEAWGPLSADIATPAKADTATAAVIAPGVHLVHARLCSVRGVCATLDEPVTVAPSAFVLPTATNAAPDTSADAKQEASLLWRVIAFLIAAARKLLAP